MDMLRNLVFSSRSQICASHLRPLCLSQHCQLNLVAQDTLECWFNQANCSSCLLIPLNCCLQPSALPHSSHTPGGQTNLHAMQGIPASGPPQLPAELHADSSHPMRACQQAEGTAATDSSLEHQLHEPCSHVLSGFQQTQLPACIL